MAATIAAVASAVASAAATGVGALGSAAAAIPAALSSLVAGTPAAAAPLAGTLEGIAPLASSIPGGAGVMGSLEGGAMGAMEGMGAGVTPGGLTLPSATQAMPSMWAKAGNVASEAAEWAQNPSGKAMQAVHKGISTQPEMSPGLKIVGNLMTELSGGAPSAPRPAAAGKGPGSLVQPTGGLVESQFEIGPDGLLHWKGAPTAAVGGGRPYG